MSNCNDGRSGESLPVFINVSWDDVECIVDTYHMCDPEELRKVHYVANDPVALSVNVPSCVYLQMENAMEVADSTGKIQKFIDVHVTAQKISDAVWQMYFKNECAHLISHDGLLWDGTSGAFYMTLDCSEIDAFGASAIIQMIAYGQVVFG